MVYQHVTRTKVSVTVRSVLTAGAVALAACGMPGMSLPTAQASSVPVPWLTALSGTQRARRMEVVIFLD